MSWFNRKPKQDPYAPPRVPYSSLSYEAQRQRRAETDPVERDKLREEREFWKDF